VIGALDATVGPIKQRERGFGPESCRPGPAYSFILTNLDVSSPARAAAAEHWCHHRTTVEKLFRDSRPGAARYSRIRA